MKKIYFHIGLGKTGTSYLQSAFAINSEKYKKEGFLYPDLDGNFKEACNGQTTSGNGLRIAAGAIPELSSHLEPYDLMDLCRSFDANFNYLISSEWLSGAGGYFLNKINKIFSEKFECKFILVVRNPADHIASTYLQGLKMGVYKFPIEYYLDELIAQEYGYLSLIDAIKDNLILINYDAHKNNLLVKFDKLIFGRIVSDIPNFKKINQSPSLHEAEILRIVSVLGLSDFNEAMKYIEGNQIKYNNEKYLLSSIIFEEIKSKLSSIISSINKYFPVDEPLEFGDGLACFEEHKLSFSDCDLNFISNLIKIKKIEKYNFLLKNFNCNSSVNSELPIWFDRVKYLLLNSDLIESEIDPVRHYLDFGRYEGRASGIDENNTKYINSGIMKHDLQSLNYSDCDGGERIISIKKLIFGNF